MRHLEYLSMSQIFLHILQKNRIGCFANIHPHLHGSSVFPYYTDDGILLMSSFGLVISRVFYLGLNFITCFDQWVSSDICPRVFKYNRKVEHDFSHCFSHEKDVSWLAYWCKENERQQTGTQLALDQVKSSTDFVNRLSDNSKEYMIVS